MIALHPRYVTDSDGHRVAVQLDVDEYEQVVERLELIDDEAAFAAAKAEGGTPVPYEQARRELGLQ
jgi:hypothetical protein